MLGSIDGILSSELTSPASKLCESGACDLVADEKTDRSAVEVILVSARDLRDPSSMIEYPSSALVP